MTSTRFESYQKEHEDNIRKHCQETGENPEQVLALDYLKEVLTRPFYLSESHKDKPNKESEAYNIVSDLMSNYVIIKGNDMHEIVEAEFYYYAKFHKDIIVYERDMDGGRFFFHQSGVDITFESHIERINGKINSQESAFGGILIRSLKRNSKNNTCEFILGPLNCVNYLWSDFNAIKPSISEYLILTYKPIEGARIAAEKRFYPIAPKRKDSKVKSLNSRFDTKVWSDLDYLRELKYRFVRSDIKPDTPSLKRYANRMPSPRPEAWML
ncbi:MAG: hypothetical protein K2O53_05455 [Bacteroidales bacterium]|nr:hypothetical protein [Bacteroidales bacterium]